MTKFVLNGRETSVTSEPDVPLLWVVRDELNLTGSKFGCGAALCGACTMLLDGEPIRACVTSLSDVEGKSITTIEGASGKVADAVKAAWQKLDVAQCGFCQSGQILAATALLSKTTSPDDKGIDEAMSGNICRCATYVRIRGAIHLAAEALKA